MDKDTLKKFTVEAKEAFASAINSKEVQTVIASASDAEANGTFKMILSNEDVDRQGEIVKLDGWDLKNYLNNPVVLWAHDYNALPIGKMVRVYVDGKNLVGEGIFASADANPFAQQVRKLYDMGIVRTGSVGFISTEYDRKTMTSVKQELLEYSLVPVPANAGAIRLNSFIMSNLGLDKQLLATKGIEINEVETDKKEVVETTETVEETKVENADGSALASPPGPVEETTTAEPKVEETQQATGDVQKGVIADELAADEMCEMKYEKLDEFFEIIWAFVDVYMDPQTPVDQFDSLIGELVTLLQTPSNEVDIEEKAIAKMVQTNKAKGIKAGRSISAKNAAALKAILEKMDEGMQAHQTAMDCHKAVGGSISELLKSNSSDEVVDQGTDEKSVEKGQNIKTVHSSKLPATREKLEELHVGRSVLVLAQDAIIDGLKRFNDRIAEAENAKRAKK